MKRVVSWTSVPPSDLYPEASAEKKALPKRTVNDCDL